jgi:hypothetical protein
LMGSFEERSYNAFAFCDRERIILPLAATVNGA